jgi:two-component system sensor kinase FixL
MATAQALPVMRPAHLPSDPALILSTVLDAMTDAVIQLDTGGRIAGWNRGAEGLYGYAAGEVLGRNVEVLVAPDNRDRCRALLAGLLAGERAEGHETLHLVKGGQPLDVSVNAAPLTDSTGRVVGAVLVIHDTGARLAARAMDARWRALVDSAVDGIVVIDDGGRIQTFNLAAQRMFGYSEEEVLGRNVAMLMPSPYHEQHDEYISRYLATGERKIIGIGRDVTGLRQGGAVFPVHLSVGEIQDGTERRFVGILHDLSTRLALEERLREQAALARLGEMAAVIAHEVRNPLTAVRGAIQVIGKRLPPASKEVEIIREIVARVDGLSDLVQDLLVFARTPQPKLAPVDLSSLLALTTDLLSSDPALLGVRVEISGSGPAVHADAELLKIAFQNVLLNAAQAMQGAGRILVTVSHEGASEQVTILDHGPGMPPAVREQLFRPFFTTKARGTGLGLATVKRLIDVHGGTVHVEFPAEGGTRVVIDLPVPP